MWEDRWRGEGGDTKDRSGGVFGGAANGHMPYSTTIETAAFPETGFSFLGGDAGVIAGEIHGYHSS